MDADELTSLHREFLKDSVRLRFDFSTTAQSRGIPPPALQKACPADGTVRSVEGLEAGIWRYLPLEHRLLFEFSEPGLGARISAACLGQRFVAQGAATFFWSVLPARMEWRYGPAAHRVLPLDAGHVCQNSYLAAEAIGAGACAVGAYDQQALDALLRLDGAEEFVLYLASVGKKDG